MNSYSYMAKSRERHILCAQFNFVFDQSSHCSPMFIALWPGCSKMLLLECSPGSVSTQPMLEIKFMRSFAICKIS